MSAIRTPVVLVAIDIDSHYLAQGLGNQRMLMRMVRSEVALKRLHGHTVARDVGLPLHLLSVEPVSAGELKPCVLTLELRHA